MVCARARVLDWVIVGGGLHGICAGRALSSQGASLRIVDPTGQLFQRWNLRSKAVAMTWMRSPSGHHLDGPPVSLHHFLHRPENADVADLAGTFRRPTHAAFLRHSQEVAEREQLQERVVRGRVDRIQRDEDHLLITGDQLALRARRILVATGTNLPRIPDWARGLQQAGAPIHHLFGGSLGHDQDLLGGGISAVQRALMMARTRTRPIRLWMRRPLHVADFDVDRDWTKHRFARRWSSLDEAARLDFLRRHRHRGSVPHGLARRLQRAVRRGSIQVIHGEPSVSWNAASGRLALSTGRESVESDGLTLATGLQAEHVRGWLRRTADDLDLPLVNTLPRLGDDMHWGHGIHVSGPLARLRLGPMAGNVVGARWASSRLPGVRMQPV